VRKVAKKAVYRIMDANGNRAMEGLRVCEDVCRFLYDEKTLTRAYKKARHALSEIVLRWQGTELLAARDIESDVGRQSSRREFKRGSVDDVFYANSQRVKESLRVLEEFAKLSDRPSAEKLKRLRYTVYALEKKAVKG
jgi:thiamine-phosphate pyrophosphorylase